MRVQFARRDGGPSTMSSVRRPGSTVSSTIARDGRRRTLDAPETLWSAAHFCLNCSSDVRKSSSSQASSLSFPASNQPAVSTGSGSSKQPRSAPFFFLIALVSDLAAFFSCFSFFAALACKSAPRAAVGEMKF